MTDLRWCFIKQYDAERSLIRHALADSPVRARIPVKGVDVIEVLPHPVGDAVILRAENNEILAILRLVPKPGETVDDSEQ